MKMPTLLVGQWQFCPGLGSSLTTLLILPLLVYLGVWQLQRWEEKLQLQNALENRSKAPPLILSSQDMQTKLKEIINEKTELQTIRFRRLEVIGHFLNTKQILVDNQILEGKVGYRVITPFLAEGDPKILLIDRGWIPLGKNRHTLPSITPIIEKVTLSGIINFPVQGIILKKNAKPFDNVWPHRVQYLDFQILSRLMQTPLYPFLLQLNEKNAYEFSLLPTSFAVSAERHLGYAVQWFIMALAVFIYFLVINSHRLHAKP
jgi:surfeit locus 1 family protein